MPVVKNYCTDKQMNKFVSQFSPIPLVTINFKTKYGNAILANNADGFHLLLQHLIEDHGYIKLAFVKGPEYNSDAIMRYDIYNFNLDLDRRNTLYKPEIIEQEHEDMRKAGFPEHAPSQ